MKISTGRTDYSAIEQEVCGLHLANDDQFIDNEFELIKAQFTAKYPELKLEEEDFEFADWHDNIRMLWVYLYSNQFYTTELLPNIHGILKSTDFKWFAQFECYSPTLEDRKNRIGLIGHFFVFKDSAVFSDSEKWDQVLKRITG